MVMIWICNQHFPKKKEEMLMGISQISWRAVFPQCQDGGCAAAHQYYCSPLLVSSFTFQPQVCSDKPGRSFGKLEMFHQMFLSLKLTLSEWNPQGIPENHKYLTQTILLQFLPSIAKLTQKLCAAKDIHVINLHREDQPFKDWNNSNVNLALSKKLMTRIEGNNFYKKRQWNMTVHEISCMSWYRSE